MIKLKNTIPNALIVFLGLFSWLATILLAMPVSGLFSNGAFSNAKVFSLLNNLLGFLLYQGIEDSHAKG